MFTSSNHFVTFCHFSGLLCLPISSNAEEKNENLRQNVKLNKTVLLRFRGKIKELNEVSGACELSTHTAAPKKVTYNRGFVSDFSDALFTQKTTDSLAAPYTIKHIGHRRQMVFGRSFISWKFHQDIFALHAYVTLFRRGA